jgi:hypothetical protein
MAGVELDSSHWPVVMVKWDVDQTMDDLQRFMDGMDAIHRRQERYVSISYMRKYATEPAQVRRVAEWMKATADDTRRWCVGTGIVTRSLGFRFLLSSIFLIRPMACPYRVCASFDEAWRFVHDEGQRRGLAVPPVPNKWSV